MRWKESPVAALIALLAIHVLAHVDRNMLLAFSPQITRDLALSNAQYGFLSGAVWVLSFGVMAVFMGTLADRFSRTRVMAAGILIWSACTMASGAAQSFEHMVAARFLVASGEAALVPAAVSLLMELFSAQRRSSAVGVFFMGIPLGIGVSFVLAGTIGVTAGWRDTFYLLGMVGIAIAIPLALLQDRRGAQAAAPRGTPFAQQVRAALGAMRAEPAVVWTILGFVLVHMAFAGLSFVQLWLVRERGFDAPDIARQIGMLQLVFGALGAVVGGVAGDRLTRRFKSGPGGLLVALVAVCGVLMVAQRLAPAGSPLFYLGMCAGFFLPLATYGPANTLIQGLTPPQMRSTVTGLTMMLINIFAIAVGTLAVGAASDRLAAAGAASPLTMVRLATDGLVIASVLFFALAARGATVRSPVPAAVLH